MEALEVITMAITVFGLFWLTTKQNEAGNDENEVF